MEIHRYEKIWFAAALVLIIAFIGTVAYGAVGAGIQMIDDEGGTIDPDEWSEHEQFEEGLGVFESDENDIDYEVTMIAQHPSFNPRDVTIPENSTVEFHITALDVIHSYDLVGTNVNTMVIPGQIAQFTVDFDETGEYLAICTEYCGERHHEMEGTLEVVSEEEWEPDEMLDNGGDG